MKSQPILLLFLAFGGKGQNQLYQNFLASLPEIKLIGNYHADLKIISRGKAGWQDLADFLYKFYQQYSGFVIFTEVSEILMLANILALIFQNSNKPMVLTGVKNSPGADSLDAKSNLINAFNVVNSEVTEVSLVFGSKVLRPSRAFYQAGNQFNVFDCWSDGLIGRIDFGFYPVNLTTQKRKLKYSPSLDDNIHSINFYPFSNLELLKNSQSRGVLIKGGALDETAVKMIHDLDQEVVLFQTEGHETCRHCLVVNQVTVEAVLAKLIWCLGQTNNHRKFQEFFKANLTGEWGPRSPNQKKV